MLVKITHVTLYGSNVVLILLRFGELSHSPEMQNDALMLHDVLTLTVRG